MQRSKLSLCAVAIAAVVLLCRTMACWPPPAASGASSPSSGDVAIIELMSEPRPGRPEWVELRNDVSTVLDLSGCSLSDGGAAQHVAFLPPGTVMPPGGYVVIAEADLSGVGGVFSDIEIGEDALVLSEVDPVEVLALHCPGEGGLVMVDQVPIGELDAGASGHSWMFAGAGWAALDNDDPLSWCLASSSQVYAEDGELADYGTPGGENGCGGSGGPPPQPGDLTVTELMVAPAVGREWFEVRSEAEEDLELSGCVVAEEGAGLVHEHTLTGERGVTALAAGGLLVMSASGIDLFGEGTQEADYEYTTLTLNNSDPEELTIRCQGIEVERVAYDWSDAGGDRGQTLSRDPDDEWCLGQDAIDVDGVTVAWGTPGAENPPCGGSEADPPQYPLPGEVVITELMVAPSSGTVFPEWLELANISERYVDLDGCVVEDDGHSSTLQGLRGLGPGQVVVIASGAFDPLCDVLVWGEYGGAVTFNNSSPDRAALACPGTAGEWSSIDEVTFDWQAWDLDKGTSLVLDADAVDAGDNDDAGNWCAAPLDAWSCEVDGHLDRGTPGFLVYCEG